MLSRKVLESYTDTLQAISDNQREQLEKVLAKIDFSDTETARAAVLEAFSTICPQYKNATSQVAAEFYDGLREIEVGERLGAVTIDDSMSEATHNATMAIVTNRQGYTTEGIASQLIARAGYDLKKVAADTVFQNAARDPKRVRYARVPSYSKTYGDGCTFCRMLASRGYVYYSARSAGSGGHYHADCRCQIVPSFDNSGAEGYDPHDYDDWKSPTSEKSE